MKFLNDTGLAHLISSIKGLLAGKVDKVAGKGLSTNDYDSTAKAKIDAIPTSPKYTDTITTINGKTGVIAKADIVALGIPAQDTNTTYGVATTSANGLMSSTDKGKLDGIASGANNYTHPSSHPISFITGLQSALDGKAAASHTHAYVPTSRTINGKALSANISLTAADVGAAATSHSHSYAPVSHTHTIANITSLQSALDGKASATHKSAYTLLRSQITVSGNTTINFQDAGQHNMYAVYSYDSTAGVTAWACTIVPATTSTTRYYVRHFPDCYTFKFYRSGTTCYLTRDSGTTITYMVYGVG